MLDHQRAESVGTGLTIGGHYDPVPVVEQAADLADRGRQITYNRLPTGRRDNRCCRLVGRRQNRPRRRAGPAHEPVEVEVQTVHVVGRDIPRQGERRRKISLFRENLRGPVAEAARLNECHQPVGTDQIGDEVFALDQPRQPRLHAIEEGAVGEAIPLFAAPRLLCNQFGRPCLSCFGWPELAARIDARRLDRFGGALVGHGEFGEPLDLVPPQVDAHGRIGGARVDVDDRAAHRHLTAMFDLSLPAVAEHDELFDEFDRVDLIAGAHLDRVDGGMRVDSLDQRPRRGHDERRRMVGCEPVEHGQALPHRLDTRADAFKRQRLPGRKMQHLVVAQDRCSIGGETLGFGLRRGSDQHRATIRRRNKAGDHEGPTRVGDGDHRFAPAEGGFDRGFLAELVE